MKDPQLDVLLMQECLEVPCRYDLPEGFLDHHAAVLVDDKFLRPSLDVDEEEEERPACFHCIEPMVLGPNEQEPAVTHPDAEEVHMLPPVDFLDAVV
ncbi:hypothetical protein SDC9_149769 [bioreactor metagenome]|uniref:Uncharacterized protein n=1 Tax=bioreactor metagenome TaxID=1076179 RepID=A0A645EPU2_9ZZZZ